MAAFASVLVRKVLKRRLPAASMKLISQRFPFFLGFETVGISPPNPPENQLSGNTNRISNVAQEPKTATQGVPK